MIVNAKKNRWHCLEGKLKKRRDYCRNRLDIEIKKKGADLIIEVSSTGTKLQEENITKIKDSAPIKGKNENEGLYLISSVLKDITGDAYYDPIEIEGKPFHEEQCSNNDECGHHTYCNRALQKNTFTVTIKPIKEKNGK